MKMMNYKQTLLGIVSLLLMQKMSVTVLDAEDVVGLP